MAKRRGTADVAPGSGEPTAGQLEPTKTAVPLGRLVYRTVPVTSLKPHPRNPRKIAPKAIKGLRGSVVRFGLVEPIVWNERTGHVLGGHQRLAVLRQESVVETDVAVVNLSEADEERLLISLNNPRIQGTFTVELADMLAAMVEADKIVAEAIGIESLLEAVRPSAAETRPGQETPVEKWAVVVELETEAQQTDLLRRLIAEEYACKAFVL